MPSTFGVTHADARAYDYITMKEQQFWDLCI